MEEEEEGQDWCEYREEWEDSVSSLPWEDTVLLTEQEA